MNLQLASPPHKSPIIAKSPRKANSPFTQIIFEDDKLFHDIKISGLALHPTAEKTNIKKRSKSVNSDVKQMQICMDQNQKQQAVELHKKLNKNVLSLTRKQLLKKKQKAFKRSITVQSVEMMYRFCANRKQSQALNKTQYNSFQNFPREQPQPRISYQKQNLNEQVYCNFKQMLDQFNKAKNKVVEKVQIPQNKVYKTAYKKPNFYQYQQFFRQNYYSKQVKQGTFLFKKTEMKNNNSDIQNSQQKFKTQGIESKQANNFCSYKSQQRSLLNSERRSKKEDKSQQIYVNINFENNQTVFKPGSISKKNHYNSPYLQIKKHSLSKTYRVEQPSKKMSIFNKTDRCEKQVIRRQQENQQVSPWVIHQVDHPIF